MEATDKEMLISTVCIKRYFPEDIGGAEALGALHNYKLIRSARIKTIKSRASAVFGDYRANMKVKFFRISKVEEAINKILSGEVRYLSTSDAKIKVRRLRDAIALMKEDKDNKEIEWK